MNIHGALMQVYYVNVCLHNVNDCGLLSAFWVKVTWLRANDIMLSLVKRVYLIGISLISSFFTLHYFSITSVWYFSAVL